jgi:hypothetical protein
VIGDALFVFGGEARGDLVAEPCTVELGEEVRCALQMGTAGLQPRSAPFLCTGMLNAHAAVSDMTAAVHSTAKSFAQSAFSLGLLETR